MVKGLVLSAASHGGHWLLVVAVIVIAGGAATALAYPVSKKHNVDLHVTVGDAERHDVQFWRNQFTGRIRISVDGEPIISRIEWLSFRLTKRY